MAQKLSEKTQRRLGYLINQAMQYGRTNNDLDGFSAAQAVVQLRAEFGIALPCLPHAREASASISAKTPNANFGFSYQSK